MSVQDNRAGAIGPSATHRGVRPERRRGQSHVWRRIDEESCYRVLEEGKRVRRFAPARRPSAARQNAGR